MTYIVSKFGGTSMQDATCMARAAEICLQRKSSMVVVSATAGTTNELVKLCDAFAKSDKQVASEIIEKLETHHLQIAKELNLENINDLKNILEELKIEKPRFKDSAKDLVLSVGERLSSILFTKALQNTYVNKKEVKLLDVRDVLITDSDYGKARPQIEKIKSQCEKLNRNCTYVTQGFIGKSEDGNTTTLGRGGSDYSAALLAEAMNADILEIWTDVAGIATTDPRICPDAKPLTEISFKEASELATFGAKILHPATLAPAMRKNIPVFVGSSFNPEEQGTWIRKESTTAPMLRALALRKNQILLTLTTPDMLNAHGFLYKIFKVFNDHKISVDAITTSEISVALTLDNPSLVKGKLIDDLSAFAEVSVEEKLSLVSLIGNNVNYTSGLAEKIFAIVSDINVRMICQGASKHNFCFLVDEEKGHEVIQRLHKGLNLATS